MVQTIGLLMVACLVGAWFTRSTTKDFLQRVGAIAVMMLVYFVLGSVVVAGWGILFPS